MPHKKRKNKDKESIPYLHFNLLADESDFPVRTVKQAILACGADYKNYHLNNVRLGLIPETAAAPVIPSSPDLSLNLYPGPFVHRGEPELEVPDFVIPLAGYEFVPNDELREIVERSLIKNIFPNNLANDLKVKRDLQAFAGNLRERFSMPKVKDLQLWGEHDGNT